MSRPRRDCVHPGNMRLWLLTYVGPYAGCDSVAGFVVRAEGEDQARHIAAEAGRDEGGNSWLRADLATCVELTAKGEPGVVLRDMHGC
jgi:hypothetical protein